VEYLKVFSQNKIKNELRVYMDRPVIISDVWMSLYGNCKLTEAFNLCMKFKFQTSERRKHNIVTCAEYK
jgi:hypothetical protein